MQGVNLFKKIEPRTFINREFMWMAEYLDGTLLFEFDKNTLEQNDFYQINKNKLLRYGYIGSGYKIYFDIPTGIFYINNDSYSFEYHDKNNTYNLTQQDIFYNDIIQYKNVHADASFLHTASRSHIYKYNLGYKCNFISDNIKFDFKPIIHIPLDKPIHFTLWLVSDKDLSGNIIIKRNNMKYEEFECELEKNRGGELTWIIKM